MLLGEWKPGDFVAQREVGGRFEDGYLGGEVRSCGSNRMVWGVLGVGKDGECGECQHLERVGRRVAEMH